MIERSALAWEAETPNTCPTSCIANRCMLEQSPVGSRHADACAGFRRAYQQYELNPLHRRPYMNCRKRYKMNKKANTCMRSNPKKTTSHKIDVCLSISNFAPDLKLGPNCKDQVLPLRRSSSMQTPSSEPASETKSSARIPVFRS